MSTAGILVGALLLDAIFGEPRWLWQRVPHPAVVMGKVIGRADQDYNEGINRKAKGVIVVIGLVLAAWLLGSLISLFGWVPQMLLAAILLAQRSLVQHVQAVGDALRLSLGDGRVMVSRIVSRDTKDMDTSAVARSAIESGAENLSDGVIAPAFWFLIGGLPGLLIYKIVNTADSMIGYKTERYKDFGWAAARLDDVLNWVPARLTALLIAVTHAGLTQWRAIRADAGLHRSPNAGWPEAAMSRALDISVAGPRSYDGVMQEFPYVNPKGRKTLTADDVDACCRALWLTWAAGLAIVVMLAIF
ncbi:adenosylcobinamide-phosphate synthase CbiB [Shimia sagamensis]|uniref:Cobalamin biosynthesis protein CobD n=1 Tax=Shimia sagamensis TaxID=1566352 RepID=A0ABY1NUU8_9RHOB|nr:adenosylcobinamide-phosphate synthase CbiB [Shimia sagamensis]SMP17531.1 adenosylcobinamide-phosphate synthase [Shimia sagamensis]